MHSDIKPTDLAAKAAISVPYASQILGGSRRPSRRLAVRIYREMGIKFPPIAHLSDDDIDAVERLEGAGA